MKGCILSVGILLAAAQTGWCKWVPLDEAKCETAPLISDYQRPVDARLRDYFGSPRIVNGKSRPHGGQDYSVPNNTPVRSAGAGIVVGYGERDSTALGCWVAVKHSETAYTIYGHLDCRYIYVQPGESVTRDTIIADSDNSGKGSGPHLHFELWTGYPRKLVNFKNKDSENNSEPGVFLLVPPPSSGFGRPTSPLCGGRIPPPAPPTPPGLPPSEYATAALLPHDPNAMVGPEGYVTPGQAMTYTVMFENEGEGTAFDVYVTDIFDSNLDDTSIVIKDFYLVDWRTNTETPTTLPYSYDPQSHKLTVLAGTFESRQGGKFTVELRLKPDVPQGTVINNFATVYFPTALEETRTNAVVSAVPQPALVAYTGSTVAVYSSYAMLAATVTSSGQTLLGKTVDFRIGDSSFTAVTGGLGEASVYPQVDIPPGNYSLSAVFPGDGYYYTSSTHTATLQVLKAGTYISDFSTVTYSSAPVVFVAMTNAGGLPILHQDTEPKNVYLDYFEGSAWKSLGSAVLSSGTAVFQFPLPEPLANTYLLKARFAGDDKYFSSESTGTLTFVDTVPPVTGLSINGTSLEDGAAVSMSGTDLITIAAVDSGVGLGNILYTVDVAFSTSAAIIYSGPFSLPVGAYIIYYSAVDRAGNSSAVKSVAVNVQEELKPPKGFLFERKYAVSSNSQYYYLDMDASGNTYVGTTQNVVRFDAAGNLTATYGSFGGGQGQFYGVSGVALGPDGNLYVADETKGNVQVFGLDGNYIRALTGFSGPTDIKFDKGGNFYVANFDTNQIVKMSTSGVVALRISASRPRGLAIDPDGNVYAANFVGSVVYKFDPSGGLLSQFSAGGEKNLYRPQGLSLDLFGNLYVADMFNSRIVVYSASGAYLGNFGTLATNPDGVLGRPAGIHVNTGTGKVFVSNYNMSSGAGELVVYSPETAAPQVPEILSPVHGVKILAPDNVLVTGSGETGRRIELSDDALLVASTSVYRTDGGFYLNIPFQRGAHRLSAEAKNVFGFGSGASGEVSFDVGDLILPAFSNPELTSINIPNWGILYGTTTIVADYNKDGNQDIVIPGMHYYKVLLGRGDGTFSQLPAVDFGDYMLVKKGAAADFNGDGKPDWVAVSGDQVFAALGNGDGTFQPLKITYTYAGTAAEDMEVLDFNNDGIPDVAVAFRDKLESFRGNVDGTFSFAGLLTIVPRWGAITIGVGDFNSDGVQDVALVDGVYFGDGVGHFPNYKSVCGAEVQNCGTLLAGDFNQDHVKDLAFAGYNGVYNNVAVFLADRKGGFLGPFIQSSPQMGAGIPMLDDFNGDGIWDIGAGDLNGLIHILPGRGDGSFGQETSLWVGNSCSYIETLAAGDFNGDGLKDIAAALNLETTCRAADLAVFFNRTPIPDVVAPATATLTLQNTAEGRVLVQWLAPGDDAWRGQASRYDLRLSFTPIVNDSAFMSAGMVLEVSSPSVAGSSESVVVSGLLPGTSYYFALRTYDEAGNVSGLSNSPGVFTRYVVQSPILVGGNPEISLVADAPLTISTESAVSGAGGIAIGSAAAQGIALGGSLYEIGPDGIYTPPIMLTFYYSTAALAAAGLLEDDVYVYEHFSDGIWRKLPDQVRDTLNHKITAPVTQIASLFGVFGVVRDRTAPVTEFAVSGASWPVAGALYINASAHIGLAAADPVVYGTSTGVAFTEFRVDAGTSSPFAAYTGPFALPAGTHVLEFRSGDNAGNIEATKSTDVFVDAEAPAAGFALAGTTYAANGNIYAAAVATVTLTAIDAASGVSALHYTVDGATSTAVSIADILLADGWARAISWYAVDNVGNVSAEQSLVVSVDTSAPVTSVNAAGQSGANGWHVSPVDISLNSSDKLSGVKGTFFGLDGLPASVYASSFTVAAEGWHTLAFYSVDNVLNKEPERTFAFRIDVTTPAVTYARLPAANAAGWNNGAIDVVFTGTDVASGIEYCSSSFTFIGEGRDIPLLGYCRDFAGWSSTAAFTVSIDTTPSVVTISSPVAGGIYLAGRDVIGITFLVEDALSGVAVSSVALVEVLDKGTPRGDRPASVNVANGQEFDPLALDDGLWRLEVAAADAAGNSTQAVSGVFEVIHDTLAPVSTLVIGEPKFSDAGLFISSVTPLLLSATDDMLLAGDRLGVGVEFTYASIDDGPATVVAGPLNILDEGFHTLAYYSVDKAGNTEPAKTAAFSVDNSAPETEHAITGPVFQGGQFYISTSAMIALSAVEPPSSGAASGLAAVFVADSTDVYVAYAGAFMAAEGAHLYRYYAKDRLGNASQAKTLALVSDGTPPATELAFSLAPSTETAGRITISSNTYVWLTGTDVHSGIAAITCSIDGSTPAVFASSFTLLPGPHSVVWWSVDNVGNAEPARVAAIQVRGQTGSDEVILNFSPEVINLKSEGKYVEARLTVSSAGGAGFNEETIRITKINGVVLAAPLYALDDQTRGQSDCSAGKGGKDKDKCVRKTKEKFFSVTAKFDRQALIGVLQADAVNVVTVEGYFDDDTVFGAEDSIRVINPGRIRKGHGGNWEHRLRARVEIGPKALKEDADISLISLYERASERLERDKNAAAKGLKRRGMPFEFGPEGTVFDEPVEISLPYDEYDAAKEKLSVAYWNPAFGDWEPLASAVDAKEKVVKAKVGHFSVYQVVSFAVAGGGVALPPGEDIQPSYTGPSEEFVQGEIYVYPNPARGGAVPVFHVECGVADAVEIRIYTISGREAHETTLGGLPQVVDGRYAYEYAWRGHIPSGIYMYAIEAQKSGRKLKKTGKFSVVR